MYSNACAQEVSMHKYTQYAKQCVQIVYTIAYAQNSHRRNVACEPAMHVRDAQYLLSLSINRGATGYKLADVTREITFR